MASAKDFAVVYFYKEDSYSEIPVSWLTSDYKQCWWPNCLNPRSCMVRGDLPNTGDTTWILYDVRFETYASTLESARKKAEEPEYATGNESLVVGPRPRKPIRKYRDYDNNSSSCSESLTPPPSPKDPLKLKHKKKATRNTLQKIKNKINETSSPGSVESSAAVFSQNEDRNKQNEEKSNCSKSSVSVSSLTVGPQISSEVSKSPTRPIMVADDEMTKPEIPVIICKEDATVADLHFELQKLQMTCDAMYKYLVSIDKRLKAFTLEKGNAELNEDWETLMSKLPLKSTEDIKNLDQVMAENEELKKKFIQFIKRMGGKDVRDNVNRALSCLFTNELGTQCSYVGFRGNFRLQEFTFINLFIEIIVLQQKCTKHEVEKCIGEWFRLSHQRGKREKKA